MIVNEEQTEVLDETLKAFAKGCNFALKIGRENNVCAAFKLQKLCYKQIREQFGLSANLAVRAIARAAGILKVEKRKNSQVSPTSVDYDARIFSFYPQDYTVGLTTLQGRMRFELNISDYQKNLLNNQMPTSAVLHKSRRGKFFINIQVTLPDVDPNGTDGGFLGVDLGIKRIATTSQGQKWDGQQLNQTRDQFAKTRARLQRKKAQKKQAKRSTRSITRLQKRLSGKERRFQNWQNHQISKTIVKTAKEEKRTIRMENLTGIKDRTKVQKKYRYRHHSWAFYQLRLQIEYKATIVGVKFETIDPAYTSQECSLCHKLGKRNALVFQCTNSNCHVTLDADHNGAVNIAAGGAVTRREAPARQG